MSRNRRRPRKGPRYLLTLTLLGLLVLTGADNLGFDWFKDFQIDLNSTSSTTDSSGGKVTENPSQDAQTSGYANIVIKDDKIFYNDETISLEALTTTLDRLDKATMTINLMDNVAYNTTFTDVENLLKDKGLKYTVSTVKSSSN